MPLGLLGFTKDEPETRYYLEVWFDSTIDPEHLGLVLATSSDIALLLNSDTKISSTLNNAEKSYGNLNHWIGRKITDFLTTESIPKIIAAIKKLESDETVLYGLELNHLDEWQFPIKYNIHRLGKDGQIILLGRDLQSVSENQQRFVKAQIAAEETIEEKRELEAHFKVLLAKTSDAMAFLNAKSGEILFSNPTFQEFFNEDTNLKKQRCSPFLLTKMNGKGSWKISIAAHGNYDVSEELNTNNGEVIFSITLIFIELPDNRLLSANCFLKQLENKGKKSQLRTCLQHFKTAPMQ